MKNIPTLRLIQSNEPHPALSLRPYANPYLEAAIEKAAAYLKELWDAVPAEQIPENPEAMNDRTKLLVSAAADVDEFLDAVRAELAYARRQAEALRSVTNLEAAAK